MSRYRSVDAASPGVAGLGIIVGGRVAHAGGLPKTEDIGDWLGREGERESTLTSAAVLLRREHDK